MAGDWLKMRTRLAEEKAVMMICDMTGLDEFAVVGRLHAIWSWAGEHTTNGDVRGVTLKTVDRVTRCEGFSAAMIATGWLEVITTDARHDVSRDVTREELQTSSLAISVFSPPEQQILGVRFPGWKKYNSKAAKDRALAAVRQARKRAKSHAANRDGKRDATVTSHAPREEKRREELSREEKTSTPNGVEQEDTAFARFWSAFPPGRKHAKAKARVAFEKAAKLADPETIIAAAAEYAASQVGQGEFVKGPEPWLNGECWNDDRTSWNRKDTSNANRNVPTAGQQFAAKPLPGFGS